MIVGKLTLDNVEGSAAGAIGILVGAEGSITLDEDGSATQHRLVMGFVLIKHLHFLFLQFERMRIACSHWEEHDAQIGRSLLTPWEE